jgi:hypothetical protein
VACPLSFDLKFSLSLSLSSSSSWALTFYVVAIATSLDAPLPLSLGRCLYCHAAATIVAPMPVSLRISCASGWLLHCDLSRRTSASLVMPAPLLSVWCLSCCASPASAGCRFANYLNVPPSLLSRRLVVALLPLSLHRCLSLCHLSHCAAISLSHRLS